VGKSSLLARSLAFARTSGIAVVLTDIQALGQAQLSDADHLYKTLAHGFAKQLGVEIDIASNWSAWLGPNINLDTIVGQVLSDCPGPVCWAIDEADLLFEKPYTNDFFGLLRSWHNRRALDPDGPWKKLSLLLSYATEAHLFITDLNQSPFNVGTRLGLTDFSDQETRQLQARHRKLQDENAWRKVHDVVRGHPYLSQCAFAFLSKGGSPNDLKVGAARQDGPFGAHHRRVLIAISQNAETLEEVRRLLRGEPFHDPVTRQRLQSAGLIRIEPDGRAEFRVPSYEDFLRAELG
jgi:hypothetical protein